MRYRRALVLAALGEPRRALHDWLVLEAGNQAGLAAGSARFAADQIAAAFRANGDEHLAAALRQRAGKNPSITAPAPPPSAR